MPCSICGREMTEKDREKGNVPDSIRNVPGWVHRRCKAEFDIRIVTSARVTENLGPRIDSMREKT